MERAENTLDSVTTEIQTSARMCGLSLRRKARRWWWWGGQGWFCSMHWGLIQVRLSEGRSLSADIMWGLFSEVDHTADGPLERSPWDGVCAGQRS